MNSSLGRITTAAGIVMVLFAIAAAQFPREMVGTWKLNRDLSQTLDPSLPRRDYVLKFDLQNQKLRETLTSTTAGEETTSILLYNLDGTETVNRLNDENLTSRATWNGNTLTLEWKDQGGTYSRTLMLSHDSRTLTVKTRDSDPDGGTTHTLLFERK